MSTKAGRLDPFRSYRDLFNVKRRKRTKPDPPSSFRILGLRVKLKERRWNKSQLRYDVGQREHESYEARHRYDAPRGPKRRVR